MTYMLLNPIVTLWTEISRAIKGAVSYFTHNFFPFCLPFYKLLMDLFTTNRGEIIDTITFISGHDLCIFPCFKCIIYQINSFALIAK